MGLQASCQLLWFQEFEVKKRQIKERSIGKMKDKINKAVCKLWVDVKQKLRDFKGQGTTEYAILVGVLVVIAIIAVVAFRGKLQQLWTDITSGINSL